MRVKTQLLCAALLVAALLAVDVSGERRKKHRRRTTTTTESPAQDEVMNILEADEIDEEADDVTNDVNYFHADPCKDMHCGAGRVCEVSEQGVGECVCIESCKEEQDPRRKVCSNYNETWGSDCEISQARCYCDTHDERCKGPDYKHIHVEYYGECRQMPECMEEDMADFPRRMRDWLFNIMRDMADRHELPEHFLKMQREAEMNLTRRWTNAAVWKWCDLDGHPHDRAVSRHELFPIRAPLMTLEHCIAPFLDSCDSDDDHKITLKEWGKCLQLEEEDMDDKCDELAQLAHLQDD